MLLDCNSIQVVFLPKRNGFFSVRFLGFHTKLLKTLD